MFIASVFNRAVCKEDKIRLHYFCTDFCEDDKAGSVLRTREWCRKCFNLSFWSLFFFLSLFSIFLIFLFLLALSSSSRPPPYFLLSSSPCCLHPHFFFLFSTILGNGPAPQAEFSAAGYFGVIVCLDFLPLQTLQLLQYGHKGTSVVTWGCWRHLTCKCCREILATAVITKVFEQFL